MVRKYFEIAEAEALLPSLSLLVEKAQDYKERLERYEHVTLRQKIMTSGEEEGRSEETLDDLGSLDVEHQTLKEALYNVVEKAGKRGAIIRDVDEGLVDFYASFEGRDVFLSWRLGERRIRFWREEEDSTRQPILELR